MRATLFILILGTLFAICFAQTLVGPTPCGVEVPPVETDAFNERDHWTNGDKNVTLWEHRLNWFSTPEADYTIYDVLIFAESYDPTTTELVQLWELEPVKGHAGYYRFPEWRREWGLNGGQTHNFGYITQASPMPLMLTFDIIKYTCTRDYDIEF